MQQPFLVQTNLLQLMGQFLQIVIHLLSPQLLTHQFLNHKHKLLLKMKVYEQNSQLSSYQ